MQSNKKKHVEIEQNETDKSQYNALRTSGIMKECNEPFKGRSTGMIFYNGTHYMDNDDCKLMTIEEFCENKKDCQDVLPIFKEVIPQKDMFVYEHDKETQSKVEFEKNQHDSQEKIANIMKKLGNLSVYNHPIYDIAGLSGMVEINNEFTKYKDIAKSVGLDSWNKKILSNNNSKTTIFLSKNIIDENTPRGPFLYEDKGIWIIINAVKGHDADVNRYTNPMNLGHRAIEISGYPATIQSQHQVEQHGEIVHVMLDLRMLSDNHVVSIRGFISDEQAIKIAEFLVEEI